MKIQDGYLVMRWPRTREVVLDATLTTCHKRPGSPELRARSESSAALAEARRIVRTRRGERVRVHVPGGCVLVTRKGERVIGSREPLPMSWIANGVLA